MYGSCVGRYRSRGQGSHLRCFATSIVNLLECIDDLEGKKSREELLAPWKDMVQKYIVFVQVRPEIHSRV